MHPISPEAKKELLEALSMQQDAFSKLEKHGVESVVFGVESAKRIVESFSTSEPENRGKQDAPLTWIPVTERLPEHGQWCLVVHDGQISMHKLVGSEFFTGIFKKNITHWQPLPLPPSVT